MNKILRLSVIVLLTISFVFTQAQTKKEREKILKETNVEKLMEISRAKASEYKANKAKALKMAKEKGWVIRKEADNVLIELQGVTERGLPLYYITHNADAAESVSTDKVHSGGGLGLDLDGTGMTAGEWDGGDVLTTHQEFNNTGSSRVNDMDGTSSTHYHATHVAGTIIAGGVEADAKGMAYNAELDAYDWNSDESEMATAAANGLLISNHSYGYGAGWSYDGSTWSWVGDTSISNEEDFQFGFYSSYCVSIDNVAINAPYYLIVKSSGNDQGDWDGSSTLHPQDGGADGFDCISYKGNAKNILTVGAVEDVPGGYSQPSDVTLTSFSSTGPCDDGRIKPDIVGNGYYLYSTYDDNNTAYNSISGTSMSSPNVTGSLLLLQEHYNESHSSFMKAATIKALAIHTADECGSNDGPDYKFGWGLLNTATAATVISNKDVSSFIKEEAISNGTSYTLDVTATGTEPLSVTIVWTDPAGTPVADQLDPTDIMLVNDLDLTVADGAKTTFYPWKLDGQNPSNAATTGNNDVDNVEKVYIENPSAGTYTITVYHEGTITDGPQNFSMIVTGITNGYAVVTTGSVTNITETEADIAGEVVSDNGNAVTERGFVYNTTGSPTTSDSKVQVGSGTGTFSTTLGSLSSSTTYYARAYAINSTGTAYGSTVEFTTACGIISTFPYTQSFDNWSVSTPGFECTSDGSVGLEDCWENVTGDVIDWDIFTGATGSSSTGPSADHTGSGNYLYTESSSCFTSTGSVLLPGFDLTSLTSADLMFWYHMYGSTMGTLYVEVSNNGGSSWTTIWTLTGDQGDSWQYASVSLNSYLSESNLLIRFTGITGSDYYSDMALDDISVEEGCTPPSTQASNFAVNETNDNDITISWTRGNGDSVLVVAAAGQAVGTDPINGTRYNASATFESGEEIGTGNFTVYNDLGTSVQITNLGPGTTYHFAIYEYNGADQCYTTPALTGNATTTGTAPVSYCTPEYSNTSDDWITNVLFNTIDNTSGQDGPSSYGDYTAISTDVCQGVPYDLSVTFESSTYTEHVLAWFDWNKNGDFTDAGESFDLGDGVSTTLTTSVTIPADASLGETRMRIIERYSQDPTPCEVSTYGEAEDYTINIISSGQWTGSNNNAWNNAGNWSDNAVPTLATDVTIPSAPSNQPVISNTGNECNLLTIESGASLTINASGEITVADDFTNNGLFTINSDVSGTGSIITQGSIGGTGSYNINQYLAAQRGWYVSSPVDGATSDVFALDPNNVLYYWNETETGTHGWNQITSTTTLEAMKGYAYKKFTTGDVTLRFSGTPNYGTIGGLDNLSAVGSTFTGYNLVGNPYPSGLNLGDFESLIGITATNLEPTVWYRTDGAFATYNWSSTTGQNGAQGVVPPMQSFWVKVDNAYTEGGLQLTDAARSHPATVIYKEQEENIFRLTLEGPTSTDELVIGFYDDALNSIDKFDSEKRLINDEDYADVYAIVDDLPLAIAGFNSNSKDISVEMGMDLKTNSTYIFDATSSIENFNCNQQVILEDRMTGTLVDLNKTPRYEFSTRQSLPDGRFIIHFHKSATGIEMENQGINIFANRRSIYIDNPGLPGQYIITNVLGQLVTNGVLTGSGGMLKIDIEENISGYIIVKVIHSNGITSEKLFIE